MRNCIMNLGIDSLKKVGDILNHINDDDLCLFIKIFAVEWSKQMFDGFMKNV